MRKLLNDVGLFHRLSEVPIQDSPQFPAQERQELRLSLIREEVRELEKANEEQNLVEVADAIGDLIYVAVGMALEYGIPLADVWDEIQQSNMNKVHDGHVLRREDGKILKPLGWKPPNVAGILARRLIKVGTKVVAKDTIYDSKVQSGTPGEVVDIVNDRLLVHWHLDNNLSEIIEVEYSAVLLCA